MIKEISFCNYKSFKEVQKLELKPLTVIIGKNSSGKSAVVKLFTLLEGSLSGSFEEPLLVANAGVELGAEFRDLVHGRTIGSIKFKLKSNKSILEVEIASGLKDSEYPIIRRWVLDDQYDLAYDDNQKLYINKLNEERLNCKFYGIQLIELNDRKVPSFESLELHFKTNYIGPFRHIPERTYNLYGKSKFTKIGNCGENAYQILISDFLYNEGKLFNKVSDWYANNFEGWGLFVNNSSTPDYKLELYRSNPKKFNVNLRDVGEGMSQALPLVVSAFMDLPEDTLTIIEQPELHLHPGAHGALAELFANQVKQKKHRFLIETHSNNFILRLRRMIAENRFNSDDILIYFIDYDEDLNESSLEKITISPNGEVSSWPEGIFSETLDETIAIRDAQLRLRK